MPIPMPAAPPYSPPASPPWADQWPPLPPAPPAPPAEEPPESQGPPPRRNRSVIVVLALALVCAVVGFELGGALFGSPTRPSATAARTATSPAPSSTTPANGNSSGSSTAASIAARVDPAVVDINTTMDGGRAAGTGMVISSSGLVLTNNHVIADATDIKVQIAGTGPTYSASVLGYDIVDDVALLQLDGASNLQTIDVGDSSTVSVRDQILAIGNALGKGGTPAVSQGVVTGLDQSISALDNGGGSRTLSGLIEINARLQPGDSGGPLVDLDGKVIGMNAAASASRRGSSDAYAIPINQALDIAKQIEAGTTSANVHIGARALLGVQVQDGQGATVAAVEPGSPADGAGLAVGDVIVSVGDATITSISDLPAALDRYHPGDRVSVAWVDSAGQRHRADVQLTSGPPA